MRYDYDDFVKKTLQQTQDLEEIVALVRERGILEIYWNVGRSLAGLAISDQILNNLSQKINEQFHANALMNEHITNWHWLKLAARWYQEHQYHDQSIVLSGIATWTDWALALELIEQPEQRYWLIAQKIKERWSTPILLHKAQELAEQCRSLCTSDLTGNK